MRTVHTLVEAESANRLPSIEVRGAGAGKETLSIVVRGAGKGDGTSFT
jgi:hypothetical protein